MMSITPWGQKKKSYNFAAKFWKAIKEWALVIAIFITVNFFLFQPFKIPSGSMIPTFLIGDFLIVNKFCYGYSNNSFRIGTVNFPALTIENRLFANKTPERGEVVVFRNQKSDDQNYIKRIIGLPGDKIQVINGVVHINDKPVVLKPAGDFSEIDDRGEYVIYKKFMEVLPNGYEHVIIKREDFGKGHLDNTAVFVVPEKHYFMMGDNRDNSTDSRVLEVVGYVPLNNILGRAECIFYSVDCKWWELWKIPFSIRFDRVMTFVK